MGKIDTFILRCWAILICPSCKVNLEIPLVLRVAPIFPEVGNLIAQPDLIFDLATINIGDI